MRLETRSLADLGLSAAQVKFDKKKTGSNIGPLRVFGGDGDFHKFQRIPGEEIGVTMGKITPYWVRYRAVVDNFSFRAGVATVDDPADFFAEPYIGLHLRGFDRPSNLYRSLELVRRVSRKSGVSRVFVASDDSSLTVAAARQLKNFEVRSFPVLATDSGVNLHYDVSAKDAQTQLQNSVRDMRLLAQSSHFVSAAGSQTGWTGFISMLRRLGVTERFFSSRTIQ